MSFTIFQNEKTPFQAIKTKSLKSRKIDIFLMGSTYGFGPKVAIFPIFIFRQYRPKKMSFTKFQKKKCLSKLQKQKVQKVEKFSFFQRGNPWCWSKNGHFSNFFFRNIGQENVFYNILERQIAFLCYKNKKFKNLKN